MQTVISADGTPIAFWPSGQGPPLLLVHGAIASHATTWRFVLPALERRFSVFAMDRRGRGESGDSPAHRLDREAEDVAAIVDSIGEPVNVLGHSFGALCAAEAALLTPNIRALILYQGVPLRGADGYAPGVLERLEAQLEAGDVDGMLVSMLSDVAGMNAEDIDVLRSQPEAWRIRVGNARTLPRELRAEQQYVFDRERFRRIQARTLLLVGENSLPREMASAEAVARSLLEATVRVLPGEQHIAMLTSPERFVAVVLDFLAAGAD